MAEYPLCQLYWSQHGSSSAKKQRRHDVESGDRVLTGELAGGMVARVEDQAMTMQAAVAWRQASGGGGGGGDAQCN
jgi:hypothetical protein